MKISDVKAFFDMAFAGRKIGKNIVVALRSHAGLGKSVITKSYVKMMRETEPDFGYRDIRLALKEACDLVGFPTVKTIGDMARTIFALPDFWPTTGRGIIFFDEINRANNSVMNAIFQILLEREVGTGYQLPEGWIIVCAMNPNTVHYDVSDMDTALTDRMSIIDIDFDAKTFKEFAKDNFNEKVYNYISSGQWTYLTPDQCKGLYVSPRTWEQMSDWEQSYDILYPDGNPVVHRQMACVKLGNEVGNAFHAFLFNEAPVLAKDLIKDRKEAFSRLDKYCKPYRGDMISATVDSLYENYCGQIESDNGDEVDLKLVLETCKHLPADQVMHSLFKILASKRNKVSRKDVMDMIQADKELIKYASSNLDEYLKN